VKDAPLQRTGDSAFGEAVAAQHGGVPEVMGLVVACCFQRIDPETGELLDYVEEVRQATSVHMHAHT